LFSIARRLLFVIPQRSGGICCNHGVADPFPVAKKRVVRRDFGLHRQRLLFVIPRLLLFVIPTIFVSHSAA
jgi:hypothetical protein